MDDQIILAVDDKGNFNGEYIPKWEGHTGKGKRHLAITVLIHNNNGQVLLQKRKHKVFNDIWDFTGATHPLHLSDHDEQSSPADETVEEATWRCLKREYGIKEKISLKNLGFFNYFARYEQKRRSGSKTHFATYDDLCENEHCAMMVGEYNGELKLNPEVGYEYKWMDKNDFLKDIEKNPKNYSPWAVEGVKILKAKNFF